MSEIILGGQKIKCQHQYEPKQYTFTKDGSIIKVWVDKTTGDGTGVTPHKRRNELSFRYGTGYNYSFKINTSGSQKNSIANIWQIKTKGETYPRISLGIKRVGTQAKFAYKINGNDSKVIDDDSKVFNIVVDCKKGELYINGKLIAKFNNHCNEDTITKFGIEADKDNVDEIISVTYSDVKLTPIK